VYFILERTPARSAAGDPDQPGQDD
jgi:hypothetical protein